MKTTTNLTPWFTNGEKPAHIGVYNVSCRKENQTGEWYSYWDGSFFHDFSWCIDRAYAYAKDDSRFTNTEGSWRGLVEKAED